MFANSPVSPAEINRDSIVALRLGYTFIGALALLLVLALLSKHCKPLHRVMSAIFRKEICQHRGCCSSPTARAVKGSLLSGGSRSHLCTGG